MIGSLFGHKDFIATDESLSKIKSALDYSINKLHIYEYYLGGRGRFDYSVSKIIWQLKKVYPQLKSYLVYSYLNENSKIYDKDEIDKYFDGSIYPPLEKVPPKYAILKRNEWIVEKSDYIIFFINWSWGGAYKSLEYAKKKKKKYINLGSLTL